MQKIIIIILSAILFCALVSWQIRQELRIDAHEKALRNHVGAIQFLLDKEKARGESTNNKE